MKRPLKQVPLTLERVDDIQTKLLPYRGDGGEAVYSRTGHRVLHVYVFTAEADVEVAPARLQRLSDGSVGLLSLVGRTIGAEDAHDRIIRPGRESFESVRF